MSENPERVAGVQTQGRTIVLGMLAVGAVALAWLLWARGQAMSKPIPAVALLPFQVASPEMTYFADGVTMDLIASLGKVEKLRVVSWNTAAKFRGKASDLRGLRDGLQAAAVLDGTFRKTGDRLQIAVKLIDTNSGEAIWQDTLDRPEREIFQIQERIAKGIVYALNVPMRMDPQRILVPVRTESLGAYGNYLRARTALADVSRESVARSAEFAEKAIAEDRKFSPAYGLLAVNYALFRNLNNEALAKAKAFAQKAIEMDSSSVEAHEALGMALAIGEWDWNAAKLEFERALQWAPNSPEAHAAFALGYLMPTGDLEGAEYEARKAVELDRQSYYANHVAAEVMVTRGNQAEFQTFQQAASKICGDCPVRSVNTALDAAAAFASIDKGIAGHSPEIAFLMVDPLYQSVRRDPRYTEALKRLKLRE